MSCARLFAPVAMLLFVASSVAALPDILRPEFKDIRKILQKRNPKFEKQLNEALDASDRELCEGHHKPKTPEQNALALRPTRTIGAIAQHIKSTCSSDEICIESLLNGELGEFMEFVLHPKRFRKENKEDNKRFNELYEKFADDLDLISRQELEGFPTLAAAPRIEPQSSVVAPTSTATKVAAPAKPATQAKAPVQAKSQPATAKTASAWQAGPAFMSNHDLTAQRLATFMRLVAANVNNKPDAEARNLWNATIKDAQKDAQTLYDKYCPYRLTRALYYVPTTLTLGLSRLIIGGPSSAKCNACDTLKAIIAGDIYKQAEETATMVVKGDGKKFQTTNSYGALGAVEESIKLPVQAMLNPATLATIVIN